MSAYYNENDPYAAQWLRNLIAAGHIAAGDVDERSIVDVQPDDLRGYTQHHFFAGIGVWSYALRLAGWPDDRPVWTGSCPCQPFSAAGKRAGAADERHLWPDWFRLVRECRPPIVLGEQVEGAIRHGWLDLVFGDLEGEGYACGAAVFGAHSVGAPHIRQRLYWVADASGARRIGPVGEPEGQARDEARMRLPGADGAPGRLADADDARSQGRRIGGDGPGECAARSGGVVSGLADANPPGRGIVGGGGLLDGERAALGDDSDGRRAVCGLADAGGGRRQQDARGASSDEGADGRQPDRDHIAPSHGEDGAGGVADAERADQRRYARGSRAQTGASGGETRPQDGNATDASSTVCHWSPFDLIPCTDGKARRVEPGSFPLAHGIPNRVGRLRAYGNAIVPQVAAAFIRACG